MKKEIVELAPWPPEAQWTEMTFHEAVCKANEKGYGVAREAWYDDKQVFTHNMKCDDEDTEAISILTLTNGVPYIPTVSDILGQDWYTVL